MKVSEVYSGKPSDLESRAQVERRARELLETLGIDCVSVDHPHADTIADCMDAEAVLGAHICKNLFLTNRQQTEFYLLLMPGDKPFKTKLLSKQLGTARLLCLAAAHGGAFGGHARLRQHPLSDERHRWQGQSRH